MLNLIKMDLYRLSRSKALRVGLIASFLVALIGMLLSLGILAIFKTAIDQDPTMAEGVDGMAMLLSMLSWLNGADWSEIVFYMTGFFSLFIGCMITASFIGSEQSCGYVKNIAGQIPHRGLLVVSKFIVTSLSQILVLLVFLATACAFTNLLFGSYITSYSIGKLLGALAVRTLLVVAINAVIVFLCTLTKSHAAAMVTGAVLSFGITKFAYMAANSVLGMLKIKIDIATLMPDGINNLLDVNNITDVLLKAILVSLIFITVFIPGAFYITEKRDVR